MGPRTLQLERRFRPDRDASARIRDWTRSSGAPQLTICIPIKNRLDLLMPCLDSLAVTCAGRSVEVVIGDTGSSRQTLEFCSSLGLRTVFISGPFSFSRACNEMASAARGKALLFLNSDTEAISPDWVDRLLDVPDGEVIGAALVYPGTRRVQHAGVEVVRGGGRLRPNVYRPPHSTRSDYSCALQHIGTGKRLDSLTTQRASVMGVTGAFLYTPRTHFHSLAGFDEAFRVDLQDIDYCLRARAQGMDVICRRDIVFSHKHAGSRGRYGFPLDDWRLFYGRWAGELERWKAVGTAV
jgi:GT2 family glycosyltransferase